MLFEWGCFKMQTYVITTLLWDEMKYKNAFGAMWSFSWVSPSY